MASLLSFKHLLIAMEYILRRATPTQNYSLMQRQTLSESDAWTVCNKDHKKYLEKQALHC